LLQTPYGGWLYSPTPITPALLRLDPIWDPLRADPAFQKLCQESSLGDTTNPNTIKEISNSSLTLICLAFFSKIFPDFVV